MKWYWKYVQDLSSWFLQALQSSGYCPVSATSTYAIRTVEVIGTLIVTRKREGVFRRKTPALEYGGCRKDYST